VTRPHAERDVELDGESVAEGGGRRLRPLAVVGLLLVLVEVTLAGTVGLAGGETFSVAVRSFTVTNLVIAAGFGGCGALLAWHRPYHPVGWLLLGCGLAQGATGVAAPLMIVGSDRRWPADASTAAATVFTWAWPWSMGLGFFLALLLFPDGRLPSRRWRPVAVAVAATGLGFVVLIGGDPSSSDLGSRVFPHWGALSGYHRLDALWTVVGILNVGCLLVTLASLAVRYRRGTEVVRRQLLWLLLALVAVVVLAVPVVVLHTGSQLILLVFVLVPAAIVVSILRYNLLDIRLVVSRTLAWATLTAALGAGYVLAVSMLGLVLARTASAVVATALVALAAHPLRLRLRRALDRVFYGDRNDPLRVLSRLGSHIAGADELTDLAAVVAESLRLPFAAIRSAGRELAAVGTVPAALHAVPLARGSEPIGELVVGVRPGSRRLSAADREMLALLAGPVAMAVQATLLAEELQAARTRVVTAREEERRRLRRDLHDGLGSVLSGIGFKADAARNYIRARPDEAVELLTQLRAESAAALTDVRRLVYGLRPPVLDDSGLVGALQRHAERLASPGGDALTVTVDAPSVLPPLPAAVEVAAYRIAAEALTNVARHAHATSVTLIVRVGELLTVTVLDDGAPQAEAWTPGVGIVGMRERAAELGGSLREGPGPSGGEVCLTLPLSPAVVDHSSPWEGDAPKEPAVTA